jgi:hypothetical protein
LYFQAHAHGRKQLLLKRRGIFILVFYGGWQLSEQGTRIGWVSLVILFSTLFCAWALLTSCLLFATSEQAPPCGLLIKLWIWSRTKHSSSGLKFMDLIKNKTFKFWFHEFVHCAPEIQKLFETVAQSCMVTSLPRQEDAAYQPATAEVWSDQSSGISDRSDQWPDHKWLRTVTSHLVKKLVIASISILKNFSQQL